MWPPRWARSSPYGAPGWESWEGQHGQYAPPEWGRYDYSDEGAYNDYSPPMGNGAGWVEARRASPWASGLYSRDGRRARSEIPHSPYEVQFSDGQWGAPHIAGDREAWRGSYWPPGGDDGAYRGDVAADYSGLRAREEEYRARYADYWEYWEQQQRQHREYYHNYISSSQPDRHWAPEPYRQDTYGAHPGGSGPHSGAPQGRSVRPVATEDVAGGRDPPAGAAGREGPSPAGELPSDGVESPLVGPDARLRRYQHFSPAWSAAESAREAYSPAATLAAEPEASEPLGSTEEEGRQADEQGGAELASRPARPALGEPIFFGGGDPLSLAGGEEDVNEDGEPAEWELTEEWKQRFEEQDRRRQKSRRGRAAEAAAEGGDRSGRSAGDGAAELPSLVEHFEMAKLSEAAARLSLLGELYGERGAAHVADLEAEVDAAYDEACGELQPPYWPCEV